MSKTKEALELAIEAMEKAEAIINEISLLMVKAGADHNKIGLFRPSIMVSAVNDCKAALEEQTNGASQLRQPLSDDEILTILENNLYANYDKYIFARAIERAHGIGE